jgi:hypothetical protein
MVEAATGEPNRFKAYRHLASWLDDRLGREEVLFGTCEYSDHLGVGKPVKRQRCLSDGLFFQKPYRNSEILTGVCAS